jgi:hypothetical protein
MFPGKPRPGFVVPKPDLAVGKSVKLNPDRANVGARPWVCLVPKWAKVYPGYRKIVSPAGAVTYVELTGQPLDRARFEAWLRYRETNPLWDDDRVYAGPWVGSRVTKEFVERGRKLCERQYSVETVACSLYVYSDWPEGNSAAENEAEEIAADVLYTVYGE